MRLITITSAIQCSGSKIISGFCFIIQLCIFCKIECAIGIHTEYFIFSIQSDLCHRFCSIIKIQLAYSSATYHSFIHCHGLTFQCRQSNFRFLIIYHNMKLNFVTVTISGSCNGIKIIFLDLFIVYKTCDSHCTISIDLKWYMRAKYFKFLYRPQSFSCHFYIPQNCIQINIFNHMFKENQIKQRCIQEITYRNRNSNRIALITHIIISRDRKTI